MVRKTGDKPALIEAQPAWEIAQLFPSQGDWSEDEYLALTSETNHFVELVDGNIEVLPMPTLTHQLIVGFLSRLLSDFVTSRELGTVVFGPLRVRLRPRNIREPDIIFMHKDNTLRAAEELWERADLVIEVVSKDRKSRRRDLIIKRNAYADARIPEYWIVDPQEEQITVLKLTGKSYKVHGQWAGKEIAASALLQGFQVQVDKVFEAGKKRA